jgi:enoyl-[acyl-carrier-protein] reductase (NADH)
MDVSCHSFTRMARLAEPLMTSGGAIFTLTYYGGEKVIEHYNVMGPVKAALEGAVRYHRRSAIRGVKMKTRRKIKRRRSRKHGVAVLQVG